MTKPLPTHIRENFIYRTIYNNVFRKNRGLSFLFLGGLGTGKSWAALRFCQDLDPNFSAERVVFSVQEFLSLIKSGDSRGKLGIGSCVLFDEIAGSEQAGSARDAMTKTNKLLSYLITTIRFKRYIIFYCAPCLKQVDSLVRKIGIGGTVVLKKVDLKRQRSIADFRWTLLSPLYTNKLYLPRPRIRKSTGELVEITGIAIPKPSQDLIKDYEEKKSEFFDRSVERWHKELTAEKSERSTKVPLKRFYKKAQKNIDEFVSFTKAGKPKVLVSAIRLKFDLTEINARHLKAILQKDIDAGKLKVIEA